MGPAVASVGQSQVGPVESGRLRRQLIRRSSRHIVVKRCSSLTDAAQLGAGDLLEVAANNGDSHLNGDLKLQPGSAGLGRFGDSIAMPEKFVGAFKIDPTMDLQRDAISISDWTPGSSHVLMYLGCLGAPV